MVEVRSNKNNKKTAILLATYNGSRYLKEQIDSLLAQTFHDWVLYVHDDGSTDNTLEILYQYAAKHDNIIILEYDSKHGAKDNFFSLMEHVESDYYFFCDQDDVWHPEKMQFFLQKMQQTEAEHTELSVIVYSDATVVDEELHTISPSFFSQAGIYPEFITNFNECGATAFIPGCAMAFNQAAKKSMVRPYHQAQMHDEWLTLSVFKARGIVTRIDGCYVCYRQHQDNAVGAADKNMLNITYRLTHLRSILQSNILHYQTLRAIGYGSLLKYLHYKIRYKVNIIKKGRKDKI